MVPSFHAGHGPTSESSDSEYVDSDESNSSDDTSCAHVQDLGPQGILHPSETDVLLGRGSMHHRHPGNMRYTEIIHGSRDRYFATDDVMTKRFIVYRIVDDILAEGRFLKRHDAMTWSTIPKDEARLKVAHAIQYLQRKTLRSRQTARKVSRDMHQSATPECNIPHHFGHESNRVDSEDGMPHLDDDTTQSTETVHVLSPLELEPFESSLVEPHPPKDDAGWDHFSDPGVACNVDGHDLHPTFHVCLQDIMLDRQPSLLLRTTSIGSFDPYQSDLLAHVVCV